MNQKKAKAIRRAVRKAVPEGLPAKAWQSEMVQHFKDGRQFDAKGVASLKPVVKVSRVVTLGACLRSAYKQVKQKQR